MITKDELELAKAAVNKIMASAEVEPVVELITANTVDGKELVFEALEVGNEVKIGEEVAPDGDYVLEDGKTIVITEGKIAEIKPKDESEDTVEDAPVVGLAEDVPVVENTEPKLSEIFNLESLAKVVDIKSMSNGYCSISFEVEDGNMVWGDLYTSDYKALLSKNEKTDETVLDLQKQLKEKDEALVALSAEEPVGTFIDAPAVGNSTKEYINEQRLMKSFLNK